MPMMTADRIHAYVDALVACASAAELLAGQADHDGSTAEWAELNAQAVYCRRLAEKWRNDANERGTAPSAEDIAKSEAFMEAVRAEQEAKATGLPLAE